LNGEIVGARFLGTERRKVVRQIRMGELVDGLGAGEVLQAMNTHVLDGGSGGQVVAHHLHRGRRQEGLAPARESPQTGATTHGLAEVVSVCEPGFARVQGETHSKGHALGPRFGMQRKLDGEHGR
jgi:hypothetical protein